MLGLGGIAFATAVLVQFAQAAGMYVMVHSMGLSDRLSFGFLLESTLVYVPALWVFSGLTVFLVGFFPKRANWVWAFYGFTFIAMMYGRMLPDIAFLANITPFGHVPQLPVDSANWFVMAALTLIAVGLTAAGVVGYNRRDINAVTH
jgi:ABC-2 type transport system permease protein